MNVYGDPAPWRPQENARRCFLRELREVSALAPLSADDARARPASAGGVRESPRTDGSGSRRVGRVPLFFHVAHLFLIHGLAVSFALATKADASWLFGGLLGGKPADWGLGLPGVYVATLLAVLILYPLCRWFARLKQNRTEWW